MSTLFRQEALEARQVQWLGGVRIGHNPSFGLVAAIAFVLAAALLAFATWGEVTRKASIPGLLVPALGTLQVAASAYGVVIERRVNEGDLVAAGQVLFVVGVDRAGTQGDTAALVAQSLLHRRQGLLAERSLRELQARQRHQALSDRIRSLALESAQAEIEVQFAQRRVALAAKSVERYEQLAGGGFVSDLQAQAKREDLIDLQSRAQSAQRTVATLWREHAALQAEQDVGATQLRSDLSQIDRTLSALAQESTENEARRRLFALAAQPGTVSALHVPLGATVQAGQALATMVPQPAAGQDSELQAHLYAPSRTTGFVQAGQVVWLRYAAFPYQKFGMARGTVGSVSHTPVNPQDLPAGQAQSLLAAAQTSEPLYRISVALASQGISAFGQLHALKPGMVLQADVIQDQRRIWEWLFEPILAAGAKLRPAVGT